MDDIFYMREALAEARASAACGEIPIGAVVVKDGEIIGRGHNTRKLDNAPLGHAELAALSQAAERLNNWRFDGCSIYVTLEPCIMCSGALMQCRVSRIVFGAKDPKGGGCGSLYCIPKDSRIYHRPELSAGILKEECAALLSDFFIKKRMERVSQNSE